MIPKLAWGLARAVPDDALAARGARAIVHQTGFVDLVPDRIEQVGSEIIFDILSTEFPLGKLREVLGDMLRSGQVHTHRRGQVELYRSVRLVVVADSNGSGGYMYLSAWVPASPPEADELAERAMDVIDGAVARGELPG